MGKVTTVNTTASLVSALLKAQGGDTIQLASGVYTGFTVRNLNFAENVTITSADPDNPAVISGRTTLTGVSNVTLDNLSFYNPVPLQQYSYFVNVVNSNGVTLSNLDIKGTPGIVNPDTGQIYPGHSGITVKTSSGVVIDKLDASVLYRGVVVDRVTDLRIANSELHEIRSDGIDFTNANGLTIENNHFHSFRPNIGLVAGKGDHPDFIQYWGTAGGTGLNDIAIRGNVFRQGDGSWTQTIFGQSDMRGTPVGAFTNFEVSGNFIQNSHTAGISLGDVVGAQIFDNVLIPSGLVDPQNTTSGRPTIDINSAGYRSGGFDPAFGTQPGNIDIHNNISAGSQRLSVPSSDLTLRAISATGNAQIEASQQNAPQFWADLKLPEITPGQDLQDWIRTATTIVLQAVDAQFGLPVALTATHGRDVLAGGDGADELTGLAGDDWLFGHAGNDVLVGGAGSDTLTGGDGADQFRFDRGDFATKALDQVLDVNFTKGDTLLLTGFDSFRFKDTADAANPLTVQSGGAAVLIDSHADLLELAGQQGVTLTETQANTYLLHIEDVGGTLDIAVSVDPNGKLAPAPESTVAKTVPAPVPAPAPTPVLSLEGGADNDTLSGTSGEDLITGGAGDDVLNGRGGNDILRGGEGRDRLVGSFGSDILQGDAGGDSFTFTFSELQASSVDRILDFDLAGGDRISFSSFATGTFDDTTILSNRLQAATNGTTAIVDSLGDLVEIDALSGFAVTRTGDTQLTLSTQIAGSAGQIEINFVGIDAAALNGFALV